MSLHLIQLLLPLREESGRAFPREIFETLAGELSERFGGLTAYTRAPAAGMWEEDSGETVRDDVVIYEVMTERLDEVWWGDLRRRLERELGQEELVIRAHQIRRL